MSRTKIVVVTDSSSDVSPELAKQHAIEVVPLTIRFGSKSYVDREDLTTIGFWEQLRRTREVPGVEAPSPDSFAKAYRQTLSGQTEEILVLCGSIGDSAANAAEAAEEIDIPVRVVDAGAVSAALEMMVLAAAEAANLGASSDDVLAAARRQDPEMLATGLSFESARRAGHVGLASYLVGRLFNLKPLMTVEKTAVRTVGRAVSRSRALSALIEWLGDRRTASRVNIVHGNAPDIAGVVDLVREQIPGLEPDVVLAGPALGIPLGAGFVGAAASRA